MSKYINMYLPWSDQDLYFDKNNSAAFFKPSSQSREEIKVEETIEVLTGICDSGLENRDYLDLWENLEIDKMTAEDLIDVVAGYADE